MRYKGLLALVAVMMSLGLQARMTDMEVLTYIKTASGAGKSEQVIGRELVARGVTPEQVERVKRQYESQQDRHATSATGTRQSDINNTRGQRTPYDQRSDRDRRRREPTVQPRTARTADPQEYQEYYYSDDNDRQPVYIEDETAPERRIYGHNVFNENSLTFAPGVNIATPQDYRLGPGDEVVIDIWGQNEEHIRQTISPEGSIMVAQLGPVYLSGHTIQQADKIIKDKFSRKYGGLADSRSDASLQLGQMRSIQVDVMGEVASPGTFTLSPFATVFNALYNAGGINDIGTLRNIEVLRNGKRVATVDIYDYLFRGKQTGNIRLQEGDMVRVSPYKELVQVEGNVKRPMYYEIKPGETLQDVINYAGGFTGDAYSEMVRITRHTGRDNELVNVERGQYGSYRLKDGDAVNVGTIQDKYANRVELRGAVERPGLYAIGTDIFTIRDLINKADGLQDDAYTGRVMLYREKPDLSLEVEALDLGAILAGAAPDIELRRNDMIVISSVGELEDRGDLTIQGEVSRPGTFPYAQGSTVEDLIMQAGGLLPGASTARVDVARRIIDPSATETSGQISEIFSLSIENGLVVGSGTDFELKPYDVVTIRRSPGYIVQEFVEVSGQVMFTGPYAIAKRDERVSDILSRAGGLTPEAYLKGASLIRRLTAEQITTRRNALLNAQRAAGNDSITIEAIEVNEFFNVGVDLQKALDNPGSEFDVVVRDGDRIYVPETTTTVNIAGEVMSPTTTTYAAGRRVKDYIDLAGGYTDLANKKRIYIVYMNGTVRKAKGRDRIEPGATVIVPTKEIKEGANKLGEVMGYIQSFASLAVMAASIASLLKK